MSPRDWGLQVTRQGPGTYAVEVEQSGQRTTHRVRVPEGLAATLGAEDVAEEELVAESFRFLLEREPATSILPSFSLDAISRYFSDYPEEMARRLSG
ncbi:MAG TPA: hypothetical protein VKY15_05210 [Acidimicrobiales bacterium]|nr:hypothetical protein [Acidimicrobiales bacterium]